MHDPFKRARSKAQLKLRRTTASAVSEMWGTLFGLSKPKRRVVSKTANPMRKAEKPAARSQTVKADKTKARKTVPATSRSQAKVPRGAFFKDATHETKFGNRSYKLYVPAAAKTSAVPLPLIVMLHGCGQTSQDFARGTGMNTLAEEFGFLVLYPDQARNAHRYRCWNWFRRSDQKRGAGEPALLTDMTRRVIDSCNADPARVYVAGLSAGAATALILATEYPDIFAAAGVHSGLAVGAAHDSASVPRAMQSGNPGQRHHVQMPTIIFHGDADKVTNPRNGRYIAIRALDPFGSLDQTEHKGRVDGGREFIRTVHRIGRGRPYVEQWVIQGSGHAWSGGHADGSFTDPSGPDASREMVRFFLRHRTTKTRRRTLPEN